MRSPEEPTALQLLESGFAAIRARPLTVLAPHWIGSAPFLAALLMFVFEMSGGVFAAERLLPSSSALALLWVWMNFWQHIYCDRLAASLANKPLSGWTPGRVLRAILLQSAIQGAKPLMVPVALLIGLPFAWTFTFFQNAMVFQGTLAATLRRSREAASMWQKQSWTLLALAALLALVVFVNIALGAFMLAQIARSLLGITAPAFSSPDAFFNTTLAAFAAAATYACVDPIVKAAYVSRCFAFESVRTGADVRASLQRIARPAALILIAAVGCISAPAQPAAIDSRDLDSAIDQVLRTPEYSWRIQRHLAPPASDSVLQRAADAIAAGFRKTGAFIGKIVEWLLDLFIDREIEMPGGGVRAASGRRVRITMLILLAALAIVLLGALWRLRGKTPAIRVASQGAPAVAPVDLSDENVSASQLEQDEWIRLADELLHKGEPRLAMRAVFLGALARLQREGLITLERFKTNLDYDRELARRARAFPHVLPVFRTLLRAFEPCWYGNAPVGPETVREMRSLLNGMNAHA